jgi:hypothetical protein
VIVVSIIDNPCHSHVSTVMTVRIKKTGPSFDDPAYLELGFPVVGGGHEPSLVFVNLVKDDLASCCG